MEHLVKQAQDLVDEAKEIATNLFEYNPGILNKNKMPLRNIQQSVASLMRECGGLFASIGKKIKEGK